MTVISESRYIQPLRAEEWKVVSLRECPLPAEMHLCDTPDKAVAYWRAHVETHPYFDSERECLVGLYLNTRRRVKGHGFLTVGTKDTLLVDPSSVFRLGIVAAAAALVLLHNHPSGDPTPSDADIKITRDLIRAGQLVKLEVLDHIVVGRGGHKSLREAGFFYN